jgi:hypothetical protein
MKEKFVFTSSGMGIGAQRNGVLINATIAIESSTAKQNRKKKIATVKKKFKVKNLKIMEWKREIGEATTPYITFLLKEYLHIHHNLNLN